MDKWQAQDAFWSSFGIPAYDQGTVPQTAEMPYITYEAVSAGLNAPQTVLASIWYRSRSWREVSNKADEIALTIKNMPPSTRIEGGRFKVRAPLSTAFAQRMSDPDEDVRRIVINVEMEFITEV